MKHAYETTAGTLLLALLTACGNSLSGTYGEGATSMAFHSNGKVEIQFMGMVQEASYVVEDGKVKVRTPKEGTMVMKIDDKGCLDGGFLLGKLCKQS